jgi:hypothetical protein
MGKVYFTSEVDDAIILYNSTDSQLEKQRIYTTKIHPPLAKLVENVIHTYKFNRYETTYIDLKHETIVHLYERLSNFSKSSGKAYSYFTVVARNFLIVKNKENYKMVVDREELEILDERRNIILEVTNEERRQLITEFVRLWAEWGLENIENLFLRDRDRKIANAVFDIFKNALSVDSYNKKALYILIREHAKVRTQYITKVVNKLKKIFAVMCEDFVKHGLINWEEYLIIYRESLEDEINSIIDENVVDDSNEEDI